ncbi:AMP-binding protein [Cryptosporangium phraense]|uniref:AMP-binding protein n=1 Tax=Cryptosporangium phraense TaxID=2593070 RepID=A0A545AWJ4_9ACTN|nr:AMP-binding protein [Cryptosporangium phraense]TQS44975.1 AMP-binding protein [Cryptosporangium phraense]
MTDPTSTFRAARDLLLATATDFNRALNRFAHPRFTEFNWALDWFDAVLATEHADDRALWIVGDTESFWTFAELSARSNQAASWLRARGVRRGDRVLVQLGDQVERWETLLALMKLGAVAVPTSSQLSPADVRGRIYRLGVRHVVARADRAAMLPADGITRIAVGPPVEGWQHYEDCRREGPGFVPDGPTMADDPLLILITPGTTGWAKAIVHTHTSYPVGHLTTMYWTGLRPGDVHLGVSSPSWGSALFTPWNAAACALVHAAAEPGPETLLALVARCGVSTLCAPPKAWRALAEGDLMSWRPHLSALRELVTIGEPVSPGVVHRVRRAWGLTIREGYGQSETTALVGHTPGSPVTLGAMGRPLPGCPVVLVDPVTGYPAAPGEEGEICLDLTRRPLGLMAHYVDAPRALPPTGRYYRTGDVAVADELGYLRYLGRVDDVFSSADHRISPVELEGVLVEHEAVGEAAVVPADGLPKAYIDLAVGHRAGPETARAILSFARSHLPPYSRVRRVEFGPLPRTVSGRVRRAELRQRESDGCRRAREYRDSDFPELVD